MLWLLSLQCSLQDCIVAGTDVGGAIRVMHEDTKATFGKCMFERAHGPLATVMEGAFAEFLDCKLAESVAAVGVEVAGGGQPHGGGALQHRPLPWLRAPHPLWCALIT